MKYNQLGNSQLSVSKISFGCMSLGKDQKTNSQLIKRAYEMGINFFDTADLYNKGQNEETVGKAVKDFRKDIILATKVGNQWKPDGSGWVWNPRKAYLLKAVDQSLLRLQTDYIDLYQLHGGTIDDPIDEVIEAFELLQQAGKIRYYGISSIRPNTIREYIHRSNIVSVMMQYSLLDRRPEESCLDMLKEANIRVITRGSLAKGMLINKAAKDYLGYPKAEVEKMQQKLKETDKPIAAALHYVFQHQAVATAAVGLRNLQQLEEVKAGYDVAIPASILKQLGSLLEANVYEKHR